MKLKVVPPSVDKTKLYHLRIQIRVIKPERNKKVNTLNARIMVTFGERQKADRGISREAEFYFFTQVVIKRVFE